MLSTLLPPKEIKHLGGAGEGAAPLAAHPCLYPEPSPLAWGPPQLLPTSPLTLGGAVTVDPGWGEGGVQPHRRLFQAGLELGALGFTKPPPGSRGAPEEDAAGRAGRRQAGGRRGAVQPRPRLPGGARARWRRRGCGRRRGKSRRSAAGAGPGTPCTRSSGNATKGNTAPPCRRRGECPGPGYPPAPHPPGQAAPPSRASRRGASPPGGGAGHPPGCGNPRDVSSSPSWVRVSGAR